jgi:hypothetical protein
MYGVPNLGLRHGQLKVLVDGKPNKELIRSLVVTNNTKPSSLLNILHRRFCNASRNQVLETMYYFEREESPIVKASSIIFWQV